MRGFRDPKRDYAILAGGGRFAVLVDASDELGDLTGVGCEVACHEEVHQRRSAIAIGKADPHRVLGVVGDVDHPERAMNLDALVVAIDGTAGIVDMRELA